MAIAIAPPFAMKDTPPGFWDRLVEKYMDDGLVGLPSYYPKTIVSKMNSRRLFNWFFYGHVWIALAATGLSWLSIRLVFDDQEWAEEWPVLIFVFSATLGVYTIHRYLSWLRAGVRPSTRRYEIVTKHPTISLIIGGISLVVAGSVGLLFIKTIWSSLLWALPITIFYLTPPIKGWRRLRDLPYVKNIWVAWAWALMTVSVPVNIIGADIKRYFIDNPSDILFCFTRPWDIGVVYTQEIIVRFAFTFTIALLFDLRDVVLDSSQNVQTIANSHPVAHRVLVGLTLACCAWFTYGYSRYAFSPDYIFTCLAISYLLMVPIAFMTYRKTSENWYAVVVNGLLLVPPFIYFLLAVLGADAGASLG